MKLFLIKTLSFCLLLIFLTNLPVYSMIEVESSSEGFDEAKYRKVRITLKEEERELCKTYKNLEKFLNLQRPTLNFLNNPAPLFAPCFFSLKDLYQRNGYHLPLTDSQEEHTLFLNQKNFLEALYFLKEHLPTEEKIIKLGDNKEKAKVRVESFNVLYTPSTADIKLDFSSGHEELPLETLKYLGFSFSLLNKDGQYTFFKVGDRDPLSSEEGLDIQLGKGVEIIQVVFGPTSFDVIGFIKSEANKDDSETFELYYHQVPPCFYRAAVRLTQKEKVADWLVFYTSVEDFIKMSGAPNSFPEIKKWKNEVALDWARECLFQRSFINNEPSVTYRHPTSWGKHSVGYMPTKPDPKKESSRELKKFIKKKSKENLLKELDPHPGSLSPINERDLAFIDLPELEKTSTQEKKKKGRSSFSTSSNHDVNKEKPKRKSAQTPRANTNIKEKNIRKSKDKDKKKD